MYRCTECGSEYKEKPDFCDCGNDIFDEIGEIADSKKLPKIELKIKSMDVFSGLIFFICLVLSVLVLMFFPKIDTSAPQKEIKQEIVKQDIPNINSFWIESKPEQQEEEVPVIEQIKTVFKPKQESPKPVKKAEVQQKQPVKTQQQKVVQQTQTKSATKPKTVQTQTVAPKNDTKPAQYSYEVINYRTALRQRFLNNLDVHKVEGEGECVIVFALSESGKLYYRNFVTKSDNDTVNDNVYKMLMRTPYYNAPPSALVGKNIRMKIKLGNSSYELKYLD